MSRKALYPIWHLIIEDSRIHLGKSIDEMDPYEREDLEDYILRRLHALYTPSGKVPTVRSEGSKECKELEEALRRNAKREEMKYIIERIIKDYKKQKEFPSRFPPPPWLKKKRKKKRVVEIVA